jgi:hypothetical protein
MQLNATVIDSSIYHDIFSTTAMRAVWSDQARIQRYLDVEKAPFYKAAVCLAGGPRHDRRGRVLHGHPVRSPSSLARNGVQPKRVAEHDSFTLKVNKPHGVRI